MVDYPEDEDDSLSLRNDLPWFGQLGYEVTTTEEEPGVVVVALRHIRNEHFTEFHYARGVNRALAVAHARERLEEEIAPRPRRQTHIWPLTILATRYGGTYEGGAWAALPVPPHAVPDAATASDLVCVDWWADPPFLVGLAATPDRALAVLEELVEHCAHPGDRRLPIPVGFRCEACGSLVKTP